MKVGDVIRVSQMGSAGVKLKHPAYARVLKYPILRYNGGGGADYKFISLHREDYTKLITTHHEVGEKGQGFCSPKFNISRVSQEEADIANALYALNGECFVREA